MTNEEIERLKAENASLLQELERLKNEIIRLVSRNLDISERLEEDVELRRRAEVARELFEGNLERQRNADLQDDAQLMGLIELRVEAERPHLKADFSSADLAHLLGVSQERLNRLFRHQSIHRTPEAALRMLREKPQWTIAAIAEECGLGNIRTLQRRVQEVIGMTPAQYRQMFVPEE